eukprot:m.261487 g.261487  ORF g.261487 m.261487 type:complete len:336 (-) comp24704_c0_seq1:268-1275(-)
MVLIRAATGPEVFNLSLYDSFVVVDVRPPEQYRLGHLATSIACPCPAAPVQTLAPAAIAQFLNVIEDFYPEHMSPLILVHDGSPACEQFARFLAGALAQAIDRALPAPSSPTTSPAVSAGEASPSFADAALARLYTCTQVWLLDYAEFHAICPQLCDPALRMQDLAPTPKYICPELLTCTRGSIQPAYYTWFGITHFVTHGPPPAHEAVPDPARTGISSFFFYVNDSLEQDLSDMWTAVCGIIDAATRAGGRVLVRVHHRAMSSSCAVAYLVHCGIDIETALARVSAAYRMPMRLAPRLRAWARAYEPATPGATPRVWQRLEASGALRALPAPAP